MFSLVRRKIVLIPLLFGFLWMAFHVPALLYGVDETIPIHSSYGADEQAPINGALHILEQKSFLALREAHNTQYGPFMSVIAVPPVIFDFVTNAIQVQSFSADVFKNEVVWSWTGSLFNARLLSFIASAFALAAVYALTVLVVGSTRTRFTFATISVMLLAVNFHFFEYSTLYRHWIFVIAILLWQLYFLERIRQEKNDTWAWVSSAVLTIFMFGISYFGIIFQAMWLLSVSFWIKNNDWVTLKKFFKYAIAVVVGCALIIWWVPGPFFRAIGIGFGDISGQGVEEHINEYYGDELSFLYYGEVVGANNIALILALMVLLGLLWRSREIFSAPIIFDIGLTAALYFVFFSVQSHHEPRYILPSTVLLVLMTGIAFAKVHQMGGVRGVFAVLASFLLVFQVLYHGVNIARYLYVIADGPEEQQLIKKLLPIVQVEPEFKVLALQDNLLGYPHTKISYARYAERYGFEGLGLFKTLAQDTYYQDDLYRLNVDYFSYFHLPDNEAPDISEYDIVVTHFRPNEPDVPNNRDGCGVNIIRYWTPEICRERYDIVYTK